MSERNREMNSKTDGLRAKYDVRKASTGEEVVTCFVLRYDRDPHARPALRAYADSCEADYPALARDLRALLGEPEAKPCGCGENCETCGSCGQPVHRTCPTWWAAPDDLWSRVVGTGTAGIRCIPCFAREAQAAGVALHWEAVPGV